MSDRNFQETLSRLKDMAPHFRAYSESMESSEHGLPIFIVDGARLVYRDGEYGFVSDNENARRLAKFLWEGSFSQDLITTCDELEFPHVHARITNQESAHQLKANSLEIPFVGDVSPLMLILSCKQYVILAMNDITLNQHVPDWVIKALAEVQFSAFLSSLTDLTASMRTSVNTMVEDSIILGQKEDELNSILQGIERL